MSSFKCPCCVDGSGSTSFNLWRHHDWTHPECPPDCPYHQKYPRNPPPVDPVVMKLMQEVGTFTIFVFCSLFFYAALQNAELTALLQQPLTPLQLNEKAVVGELCDFLEGKPRLIQAVLDRLCPGVPGTPPTEPRVKRLNDTSTPPIDDGSSWTDSCKFNSFVNCWIKSASNFSLVFLQNRWN